MGERDLTCVAIIPARGGSVRIPRKNIKSFLGKPIIAYSIEVALESRCFERVIVSTDDEEIATVARKYGAEVPFFRSAKTSDNHATLNDVMEEVISELQKRKAGFEIGCCLLPTAPFITAKRLKEGFDLLVEKNFDSVRPIVRFDYPIQRAFKLHDDGKVSFYYPEFATTRSQDLEPGYHDAGQFYWFKTDRLLRGLNKGGFELRSSEVQDIDTLDDWEIAEFKYRYFMNKIQTT